MVLIGTADNSQVCGWRPLMATHSNNESKEKNMKKRFG